MSKFAASPILIPASAQTVTNLAGGEAYKQSPKVALTSLVLTSMLQGKAYTSEGAEVGTLRNLVNEVCKKPDDAHYCARLAMYARNVHGLRSVSHVIAGELSRLKPTAVMPWRSRFFDKIVRRVDDATEIVSYYRSMYGKKSLPNALKRGLAKALVRFDAYALSKYQGNGALKLRDVVNLVHPKAKDTESPLHALMKGTLKPADTWEAAISEAGREEGSAETEWVRLLKEKKLGYLACLRNLRNIAEKAPAAVDQALALLTDPEKVEKSLTFPFQFATAAQALEGCTAPAARRLLDGVSVAAELAMANVPKFEGKTLIALDDSGSMTSGQSRGFKNAMHIGSLFAAVLYKANPGAELMLFSDDARYVTMNTRMPVLDLAAKIAGHAVSAGTNFHSIFARAARGYDRIVILSDMQGWMGLGTPLGEFESHRRKTSSNPFIYSFDLTGHGTSQFPSNRVCLLAGWSDKIFEIMPLVEKDKMALIKEIEQYDF